MKTISRYIMTLALLLTAAGGAWAQTEELLTTITATGTGSYSEETPGVVTVTLSNVAGYSSTYGWLWGEKSGPGSVTVEAKEGYIITRCVFKQNDKTPVTITTSPFAITFANGKCEQSTHDIDGVSSIEVYGIAPTPNSIVINGTPQVGDKSISLTYYFNPKNVPNLEAFAPTLKVKCDAVSNYDEILLSLSEVSSGTTNITLKNLGEFEAGKTYDVCFAYNNGSWVDEVFQSFVPAEPAIEVTINDDKTEASFLMPTDDVTVNYELVRDITQKVDVETRIDGTATERVRIAKDGDGHYKFVTKQEWGWQFAAVDKLDNNKDLTNGELTYTFKMKEGNDYVAKNFDTDLCPGTWRLEAEANADKPYDGIAYGPDILLYDFKNISFAKGYTTHYYSESLVLDEVQTGLHFYAVTAVTSEKVTLTEIEGKAIPGGTPFIVYNETAEPITAVMGMLQADDVTSAEQFKGTAEDKKMDAQSGCYVLRNGDSTPTFRLVKGAGTLPAHRCYIELGAAAGTRSLGFDFGDGTTRIEELKNGRIEEGEYYDLQGRKHQGTPQRKGVYVKDGRKVIVR